MKAFFSEEQLLHQPLQFMRAGRICKPTDVPARAESLSAALARAGIALETPPDYGHAVLAVHSLEYLEFLKNAYSRWQALRQRGIEPGPEVLPNQSPYQAMRAESLGRGPCPSNSIIAQAGYYLSDLSCPIGPHTWQAALRSTHCAVAAADWVSANKDIAYALCRPSGHHAHYDRAGGFCYLNNSAIAAQRLRETFSSVVVLDLDAHHGDGTQNIFYQRSDVMTVSLHADPGEYFPFYTGYAHERGHGSGNGYNINVPLPHGTTTTGFVSALDDVLVTLRDFRPQAIVVALGFDGYRDDPISVLDLDMDAYRHIGERISAQGLPTVVVQEGGYMVEAIGEALGELLRGLKASQS